MVPSHAPMRSTYREALLAPCHHIFRLQNQDIIVLCHTPIGQRSKLEFLAFVWSGLDGRPIDYGELAMGIAPWAKRAGTALVLGTLISTLLAVLLYAFTSTPPADALIIGLVGTALAILMEVVIRLEHIADDTSLLRRAGNFSDQVRELVEGTGRIVASYHDLGPERSLKERYDELIEDLGNLEDGRITSHGSDYRHLLEAMTTSHARVEAVTNVIGSGGGDPELWT
jgi:hypothetical protein